MPRHLTLHLTHLLTAPRRTDRVTHRPIIDLERADTVDMDHMEEEVMEAWVDMEEDMEDTVVG